MKKMKQDVLERLEEYKKEFKKDAQKAELILRSEKFNRELESLVETFLSEDFFAIRKPIVALFPKKRVLEKVISRKDIEVPGNLYEKQSFESLVAKALSNIQRSATELLDEKSIEKSTSSDGEKKDTAPKRVKEENSTYEPSDNGIDECERMWTRFCERWGILPEWDGDQKTLKDNLRSTVQIYFLDREKREENVLFLQINNWTTLNDVKEAWEYVEKYQKKMGTKQEKKSNFTRDLCWYDLSVVHKMSNREIADLWKDKYPDEVDLLVIRRLKKLIDKQDLKGRRLEEEELFNEVKSGVLKDKYFSLFKDESAYYISGISSGRKVYPPFHDAIRKAIKRMNDQISSIETVLSANLHGIDQMMRSGFYSLDRSNFPSLPEKDT